MGYKHDREQFQTMIFGVQSLLNQVNEIAEKSGEHIQKIVDSGAMKGKSATAITKYMNEVHGVMGGALQAACIGIYDVADRYLADYVSLDDSSTAKMVQDDLEEINSALDSGKADQIDVIHSKIQAAWDSANATAGKCYRIPASPISVLDNLAKVSKDTVDLRDQFVAIETKYAADEELKKADAQLQALKSFFDAETERQRKGNTDLDAVWSSREYKALVSSYSALVDKINENAAETAKARDINGEYTDKLIREYEERKREAEAKKKAVGIGLAILGAVVTVCTAGAGGILVGAAIGAAVGAGSGAINSFVGSIEDQKVGSIGCRGSIDMGKVWKDTAKGALIGGVTGAIGGAIGGSGASGLAKVGLKAAEKAVGGEAARIIDRAIEGEALFQEGDLKQIAGDAAKGAVSGALGEALKWGQDKVIGTHDISKGNTVWENITVGGSNVGGEVVKGSIGRGVKTAITSGGDMNEVWKDMTDAKEIKKDITNGVIENGVAIGFAEYDKALDIERTKAGDRAADAAWDKYAKSKHHVWGESKTKDRIINEARKNEIDNGFYGQVGKGVSNAAKPTVENYYESEAEQQEVIDKARQARENQAPNRVVIYNDQLSGDGLTVDEEATERETTNYQNQKTQKVAKTIFDTALNAVDSAQQFFGGAMPEFN